MFSRLRKLWQPPMPVPTLIWRGCVKCGSPLLSGTAYKRDDKPNPPQEWLQKTCGCCGYSWKALTLDTVTT